MPRIVALFTTILVLLGIFQTNTQCLNSTLTWNRTELSVLRNNPPVWSGTEITFSGQGKDFGKGGTGNNEDSFLFETFFTSKNDGFMITKIKTFPDIKDPCSGGPMVYFPPTTTNGNYSAFFFPQINKNDGKLRRRVGPTYTETTINDAVGGVVASGKLYYGYTKIEKIGTLVSNYYSDDGISWILLSRFNIRANVDVSWGFALYTKTEVVSITFDFFAVSGFSSGAQCPTNTYCSNINSGCTRDPITTFVECSTNSWRNALSGKDVQNAPSNIITPTYFYLNYLAAFPAAGDDGYNFLFKRINFQTFPIMITMKADWGSNPQNGAYGGVMIMNSEFLDGKIGSGANTLMQCVMKYGKGNDIMKYRNNAATSTIDNTFATDRPTKGGPYWIRLLYDNDLFSCGNSFDGFIWTYSSTVSISSSVFVNKTMDIGVLQGALPLNISKISLYATTNSWCNNRASECGIDQNLAAKDTETLNLDRCICNPGYIGSMCETTVCFGILQNDTNVCSGNGICTGPNLCQCNSGWSGDRCQFPSCFGVSTSSPFVCNGNGKCSYTDQCVCNNGYTGDKCQTPICYGIESTNSRVCSSNGRCLEPNACLCNTGYTGNNCSDCALGYSMVNGVCTLTGINCASSPCIFLGNSCREVRDYYLGKGITPVDGVYRLRSYLAYCDMTYDSGGWTLLLKQRSRNGEMKYSLFDPANYPGTDSDLNLNTNSVFLKAYNDVSFTQLLLTINVEDQSCCSGLNPRNRTLVINHAASSLNSIIKPGTYVAFQNPPTTAQWLDWIGPKGNLQSNCIRNGFNIRVTNTPVDKIRIGVHANDKADCTGNQDTFIGFGGTDTLSTAGLPSYYNGLAPSLGHLGANNPKRSIGGDGTIFGRTNFDCSSLNWCSGNGRCTANNQCTCNSGFIGSSCSQCPTGFSLFYDTCLPNSINCINSNCTIIGKSCRDIRNYYLGKGQNATTGIYTIKGSLFYYNTYCEMSFSGGGWTLALKQNGTLQVLKSTSSFWTDFNLLNENDTTLNAGESKYNSYLDVSFNQLYFLLNVEDRSCCSGNNTQGRQLLITHNQTSSLYSVISPGTFVPFATSPTRTDWINFIGPRGSLQNSCYTTGFNTGASSRMFVRIGATADSSASCTSQNSGVGFGLTSPYSTAGFLITASLYSPNSPSVGMRCAGTDCTSNVQIGGTGFVFIRENYDCSALNWCSGNGICNTQSQCTCDAGYSGSRCDVTSCFSISSNQTDVCSARGVCQSINNCTCNTGFSGNNCQFSQYSILNSSLSILTQRSNVSFTFNTSIPLSSNYRCSSQFGFFSALYINSNTIQCIDITTSSTESVTLEISILLGQSIIHERKFLIYYQVRDNIFSSINSYQTGQNLDFVFSLASGVDQNYTRGLLFCQVDFNLYYPVNSTSRYDFICSVPFGKNINITFWLGNSRISLNTQEIFYYDVFSTSYHPNSTQVGFKNEIILPKFTLTPSFGSPTAQFLKTKFNNIFYDTTLNQGNIDTNVSSQDVGIFNINLDLSLPYSKKISNIISTFAERFIIKIDTVLTLLRGSLFKVQLNTLNLIQRNKLKSKCEDLIITYQDNPIPRKIYNCSTSSTTILFNLQDEIGNSTLDYNIYYNNPNISTILDLNSVVSDVYTKTESPYFGSSVGTLFDDATYSLVKKINLRVSTQVLSMECIYANGQRTVQRPFTTAGDLIEITLGDREYIKNVTFSIGKINSEIGGLMIETNQRVFGPYANLAPALMPLQYHIDTRAGIMNCKGSYGIVNSVPVLTGLQFDYRLTEHPYEWSKTLDETTYINMGVPSAIQFDDNTNSRVKEVFLCGNTSLLGIGFTYKNGVKRVYGDRYCVGNTIVNVVLRNDEYITNVQYAYSTTSVLIGTFRFTTNYGFYGPYATLTSSTNTFSQNTGFGISNLRGTYLISPLKITGLQFDFFLNQNQVSNEQYIIRTTNRYGSLFLPSRDINFDDDQMPRNNTGVSSFTLWVDNPNNINVIYAIRFTYSNGVTGKTFGGTISRTAVTTTLASNEFIQFVRVNTTGDGTFMNSMQFQTNLRTITFGSVTPTIELSVGSGIINVKAWVDSGSTRDLVSIQFDYISYDTKYLTTSMIGETQLNEKYINDEAYSPISRILISGGTKIDALTIYYQNGLVTYTGTNVKDYSNFIELANNERILNITSRRNTNGELGQLIFRTNLRVLGPYGTLLGSTLTNVIYQVDTSMGPIVNVRKGYIHPTIYNIQFDVLPEPTFSLIPQYSPNNFTSNTLQMTVLERTNLLSIDPIASVVGFAIPAVVTTNLSNYDFGSSIQYEIRYDNVSLSCNKTSNLINFIVPSFSQSKVLNISLWATHNASRRSYLISNSEIQFFVYPLLNQRFLYPFIGKYSQANVLTTYPVSIYIDQSLRSAQNLICKYYFNGTLNIVPATLLSDTELRCNIAIRPNLNIEFVQISLSSIYGRNGENRDISTSNSTFVIYKEPISIDFQNLPFLNSSSFGQQFTINMVDLRNIAGVSFTGYTFSYNNYSQNLTCTYQSTIQCSISQTTFNLSPILLDFKVDFISNATSLVTSLQLNSIYFVQTISIQEEFPFIANPKLYTNNSLTVQLNLSTPLNTLFNYYSIINQIIRPVQRTNDLKIVTLSFNSSGINEIIPITLYVNSSTFSSIISNSTTIEFAELSFSKKSTNIEAIETYTILKGTQNYILPSKYQGDSYQVISSDSENFQLPCRVNLGVISCNKTNIFNLVQNLDITDLFFKLQFRSRDFIIFSDPLLVYKSNSIDFDPPAKIIDNTVNNFTIFFSNITLRTVKTLNYFCGNESNSWNATRISNTQISCQIPPTFNSIFYVSVWFVFSSQINYLSKESNLFYYVTPDLLSYTSSNILFLTNTNSNLTFNYRTAIPSKLLNNLQFKIGGTYKTTGVLSSTQFNTSFSSNINGRNLVDLWYNYNTNIQSQISSNSLSLFFVTLSTITNVFPTVIAPQDDNIVQISTNLPIADYGSSIFSVRFENSTLFGNTSICNVNGGNSFDCNIYWPDTISKSIVVSIWISLNGTTFKITDNAQILVENFFFTPSYGYYYLSQSLRMPKYTLGNDTNVRFDIYPQIQFNCSRNVTILTCLTVPLSESLSFASYLLRFTLDSSPVSSFYVVYDNRSFISYNPKVISINTVFNFTATLNKNITLTEGFIYGAVEIGNSQKSRFNFGSYLNSTSIISGSITSISKAGNYSIELLYQNSKLTSLYLNMIEFTPEYPIRYTSISPITMNPALNIYDINTIYNVTLTLSNDVSLSSSQYQFVKCKQGNTLVNTIFIDNFNFACMIQSNSTKVDTLSLSYINNDAYQGDVRISEFIDLIFINQINLTDVFPHSIIKSSETVLLSSSLPSDVYQNKVTYQCEFDGQFTTATINQTQFSCLITKNGVNEYISQVYVNIVTSFGRRRLSSSINFTFLNLIQRVSIYPFSKQVINPIGIINETISWNIYSSQLLTTRNLMCRYNSSLLIDYSSTYVENGILKCNISLRNFTIIPNQQMDVSLYIDLAQFSFIYSINDYFIFVKDLLVWNTPKITNQIIISPNYINSNYYSLKIIMSSFLGIPSQLNCNSNRTLTCNFTSSLTSITSFPNDLNFNLILTHPVSNLTQNITFDFITFYQTFDIQHLKPFVFIYSQKLFTPLRVVANINHPNLNIQRITKNLTIVISQGALTFNTSMDLNLINSEYESTLVQNTHFSFSFTSFGVSNSFYNIDIFFGDILLTRSPAQIQVINSLQISPLLGPNTGKTSIGVNLNLVYPTSYRRYNITLSLYDRGNYINLEQCNSYATFSLCFTPSVISLYNDWSLSRKFRIDLRINNIYALTTQPYFTFFKSIDILRISPSNYMIANYPYTLTFKTNLIDFQSIDLIISTAQKQTKKCTVNSFDTFTCESFSINAVPNLFINVNNNDELLLNVSLVPVNPITFSNNPSIMKLVRTNQNIVFIFGTFPNSPDLTGRIKDQNRFSLITPVQFINESCVQVTIPPIYEYKFIFPISWKLEISIDSGTYYFMVPTTYIYDGFETLQITPTLLPSNFSSNFKISNFPSQFYLSSSETLSFRMVNILDENDFIPISCTNLSCIMPSTNSTKSYQILLGINQFRPIYFGSNIISTYSLPSLSNAIITPSLIVRSTTKTLKISNVNFKQFDKLFIVLRPITALFAVGDIFLSTNITNNEIIADLPAVLPLQKKFSILLSVNSDYLHETIFTIDILDDYNLKVIRNLENLRFPNNIFSFVSTDIQILGDNIFNSSNYRFLLNNTVFQYDLSSRAYIFANNSYIIRFPLISEINLGYSIQYPFKLSFGLSYNNLDYKFIDFYYVNTFPSAIFTNIYPNIIGRNPINITIFGLNIDLAIDCLIYDLQSINGTESNGTLITQSKILYSTKSSLCPLPSFNKLNKISMYVQNEQKDRSSNYIDLFIYETPIISNVSITTMPSYANLEVTINGINFTNSENINKIYCSVGSKECSKTCSFVNDKQIKCFIDSNPTGTFPLLISYNKVEYFNVTNLQFTDCLPGYSSSDYTIPCTLCGPGTYKPTSGFYRCLPCDNSTYQQFTGALTCDKCPDNTTTIGVGTSSPNGCVCKVGYYMNPKKEEVNGLYQKCVICPTGGVCSNINTTIPLAAEGYWYDGSDYSNFEICTPKESCPGGGFSNCSREYAGPRCGYCSRNFYRNRKYCLECDKVENVWTRLVIIAIVVMIITLIFFILASVKVSHISSLAIALSLWQVLAIFSRFDIKWPYQLEASVSVASVSNLNTDFLSPNCIAPNLDYLGLWFLKMIIPFVFLFSFILLYFIFFIRSTFAMTCIKIKYIKADFDSDSDSDEEKPQKSKVIQLLQKILNIIKSGIYWVRNFIVWFFTERSSKRDFIKIYNKMWNAYMSFISFSFMFIITTSSEIFVCVQQSNGKKTMEYSPDLFCYEGRWWIMAPFSIIYYLIFGIGSLLYFVIIYFKYNEWSKDKGFNERNKFMISRFKKGYFYWEAVVTVRKTILSIVSIFFKPMFIIVSGVLILFIGILLHMYFVPFKKKFHNLIEYLVLMITMFVLFLGLLFYIDKIQDQTFKAAIQWVAFLLIVVGTITVVLLILTDVWIRKRKEKRKKKIQMKEIREQEKKNERFQEILEDLHPGIQNPNKMAWDEDYDYKPITFVTDEESPEDKGTGINDLFDNIFSERRFKRAINSARKKINKLTKRNILDVNTLDKKEEKPQNQKENEKYTFKSKAKVKNLKKEEEKNE